MHRIRHKVQGRALGFKPAISKSFSERVRLFGDNRYPFDLIISYSIQQFRDVCWGENVCSMYVGVVVGTKIQPPLPFTYGRTCFLTVSPSLRSGARGLTGDGCGWFQHIQAGAVPGRCACCRLVQEPDLPQSQQQKVTHEPRAPSKQQSLVVIDNASVPQE
jgi:hypothetical protein